MLRPQEVILIACAGDEIYANQSSIIGSIGVIFSSFGFKDLIKKLELKEEYILLVKIKVLRSIYGRETRRY